MRPDLEVMRLSCGQPIDCFAMQIGYAVIGIFIVYVGIKIYVLFRGSK